MARKPLEKVSTSVALVGIKHDADDCGRFQSLPFPLVRSPLNAHTQQQQPYHQQQQHQQLYQQHGLALPGGNSYLLQPTTNSGITLLLKETPCELSLMRTLCLHILDLSSPFPSFTFTSVIYYKPVTRATHGLVCSSLSTFLIPKVIWPHISNDAPPNGRTSLVDTETVHRSMRW